MENANSFGYLVDEGDQVGLSRTSWSQRVYVRVTFAEICFVAGPGEVLRINTQTRLCDRTVIVSVDSEDTGFCRYYHLNPGECGLSYCTAILESVGTRKAGGEEHSFIHGLACNTSCANSG